MAWYFSFIDSHMPFATPRNKSGTKGFTLLKAKKLSKYLEDHLGILLDISHAHMLTLLCTFNILPYSAIG